MLGKAEKYNENFETKVNSELDTLEGTLKYN